jgi:hypothetical protein
MTVTLKVRVATFPYPSVVYTVTTLPRKRATPDPDSKLTGLVTDYFVPLRN